MLRQDKVKSWLLVLLCGTVLATIHYSLLPSLTSRDLLIGWGTLAGAYVVVPAISAWFVSQWTQSWDAGLKAGCLTGLFGGIAVFGVILTPTVSHGQLFAGGGLVLKILLYVFFSCFFGICISPGGALLGCKIAHVEP